MTCKVTLKRDDDYYNNTVEISFNGDDTATEWLKYFRRFMLACSFTQKTVDGYIPEDIENE